MRGQPHFVESPEPIPTGRDYQALCGKIISKAYFAFTWDVEMMGGRTFIPHTVCAKCRGLAFLPEKAMRYIYGAVPGDEVKKREGQDDAE